MCIACTSTAVARVLDGGFRKPVCATHRSLYSQRGYLIDALATQPTTTAADAEEVDRG